MVQRSAQLGQLSLVSSQSIVEIYSEILFPDRRRRIYVGSRSPQTSQAGDDFASLYAMVVLSSGDGIPGLVSILLSIVAPHAEISL